MQFIMSLENLKILQFSSLVFKHSLFANKKQNAASYSNKLKTQATSASYSNKLKAQATSASYSNKLKAQINHSVIMA
jgi:hypothetical protein